MSNAAQTGQIKIKYKVHWHVLLTHFPVSFFMLSSGFMILHLYTRGDCFELSAFLSLFAGALIMLPTTISGWLTWKGRYQGMRGKMFLYKIRIAFGMIALNFALILIRLVFHPQLHSAWMWIYAVSVLLLLTGAMVEGFYGGRLNHR
jgi:uncharacterized membrane protein